MASEIATRSPAFVDGKAQNAQELRLHALSSGGGSSPLAARGGVRPSAGSPGLVAALATAAMKVRVNAGIADIPSASASGGFYRVSWDQVDLDIDPSSAQARTDLAIVEVVDTGTSAATGKVRILKGTSGGGRPTNPVANAHWLSLAAVAVRVGAESSGNIRAQDVTPEALFAVAPGADIPVRNQAEFDALPTWPLLTVQRLDTGVIVRRNAADTAWETIYDPAAAAGWTAFTPTWTAASSAPSLGNGTLTGRYKQIGKTVHVSITLTFGSTSSGGTGGWGFTVPVAGVAGREQILSTKAFTAGVKNWGGVAVLNGSAINPTLPTAQGDASAKTVQNADSTAATGTGVPAIPGSYTFINGSNFAITGTYEAA